MSEQAIAFLIGAATIPVLFAVFLILRALYALSTNVWVKFHKRLLHRVDVKPNPMNIRFRGSTEPEEAPRPKYEDSANKMRDALLTSPRFWLFTGLGWYVIVGQDTKEKPEMQ